LKILVTGSSGLLGSAFKNILGHEHIFHTRKDADLLDSKSTHEYLRHQIQNNGVDTVIHAAAIVGGLQANLDGNDRFFYENYKINSNVLNACFDLKVDNFVNILSTCIFPHEHITYPLTKEQIDNGPPHPSNSGYAYAKRLGGHQTKILGEVLGKNWFSVVPTNLYGPNDNFNLRTSHLVAGMIHRAFLCKQKGEKFTIWGDGSPLRQFIYAEDLAKMILWALENWNSNDHFMAVNTEEVSVMEVANMICDILEISEEDISFDPDKPKGQFRKPAASDLPGFEFKPLKHGIKETISWLTNNYYKARI
jgi:GDP-L-fucose synthase